MRKRRSTLTQLCNENEQLFLEAIERTPREDDSPVRPQVRITELDQLRLLTVRYFALRYSLSYDAIVRKLYELNFRFRPHESGFDVTLSSLLGPTTCERFERIMREEGYRPGSKVWSGQHQVIEGQTHPIARKLERLKRTNPLRYFAEYPKLIAQLRESLHKTRSKRRYRNNPWHPAVTA